MKRIFIIANWKSNKDSIQVKDWIERFKNYDLRFTNKEVIVCPSFLHSPILKSYILNPPAGRAGHKSSIKLGVQDISPFDEGAYTGEVNGKQIKEFADYVIIGHSERRENFYENDAMLLQKLNLVRKYDLIPIFCISDVSQIPTSHLSLLTSGAIIAYEPLFAIGSGTADTPENADEIAQKIKKERGETPVLYGGSVNSKNVKKFTQMPNIDGVLVGGASLDPLEFAEIVKNA